jgi:hypothetical protein
MTMTNFPPDLERQYAEQVAALAKNDKTCSKCKYWGEPDTVLDGRECSRIVARVASSVPAAAAWLIAWGDPCLLITQENFSCSEFAKKEEGETK